MRIQSIAEDLQDGSRRIEYSGLAGRQKRYIFPETQTTIDFRNEGSKPITLIVNGSTYIVAAGEQKSITKSIKAFTVVASESAPLTGFTVQGWRSPDVKDFEGVKPIQVATRCSAGHTGATVAGTIVGDTYRQAHVMNTECSQLQFVLTNFYPTVTTESSNANAFKAAITLEYKGLVSRIFFNGQRVVTIDQGGEAISQPINRTIPKGDTFHTKIWIGTLADGDTYPVSLGLVSSLGDGKASGDQTLTAGAIADSTAAAFTPSAIIGIPAKADAVAFALLGDSMVGDANGDGWPVLAVEEDYGYMILSRPGSTVDTMEQNSGNAYRLRLCRFATHAIITYGSNDWNLPVTFATQEGYNMNLWASLQRMGLDVYHATTPPRSSSTDNWDTVENQTAYNGNGFQSKRAAFNQRLRDGVYPVKVLDVSDAVESARDAGTWKAAYTGDGVHPLPAAKDAVNAFISLDIN